MKDGQASLTRTNRDDALAALFKARVSVHKISGLRLQAVSELLDVYHAQDVRYALYESIMRTRSDEPRRCVPYASAMLKTNPNLFEQHPRRRSRQ